MASRISIIGAHGRVTVPGSWVDCEATKLNWESHGIDHRTGAMTFYAHVAKCGGLLVALVSQDQTADGLLWHLSISYRDRFGEPSRCPTWDELKHAKYHLIPPEVAMAIYMPGADQPYVDDYPSCMHLWQVDRKECET